MTDLTPRPGAAPLWRMVLAHAGMESRLLLRNGEQLLIAIVIPVMVLIGGYEGGKHLTLSFAKTPQQLIDTIAPGVLALAVMSTSFASLAIATGFERRYGVIKRLGASPLSRNGLLLGKILGLLTIEALQIAVLSVVALIMGWSPQTCLAGLVGALLAALLGTAAFASLGLLIAGVLRAEATLAAANLVYLLLMAGGAVVLPRSSYGEFGHVTKYLPSGALGDAMRSGLLEGHIGAGSLVVLTVWTVLAAVGTARTFRWE